MNKNLVAALILAASTLLISAQEPKVSNTKLHSSPVGASLSATVDRFRRSSAPAWVGYQVQALGQTHLSACSSWSGSSQVEDQCCNEYNLEDSHSHMNISDHPGSADPAVDVLLRFEHGAVTRVRLAPAACTLNAGGLPLEWITGVQPDDSVAFLGHIATGTAPGQPQEILDESLFAIAIHATPKATTVLTTIAGSDSPHLREKAGFWLAAQRGHEGFLGLQQLLTKESDPELRRKLAFDFSINSDPAATDELIRMAKSDTDGGVRGQALFWLAQKAGKKAIGALQESMENDPDFDVKKKAVFALSQLPKEESVPQLVHVADTNKNLAIRKEAIFWLGQTDDPRALAYLETILKR